MRYNTRSVHFQSKIDSRETSKNNPIYQTSAFSFKDLDDMESFYQGDKKYLYSRVGNPNTDDLASGVAQLESAEAGVATSSGLSAILVGILSVAKHGDHIIATEDLYGGTYEMLHNQLAEFGIEVDFVDMTDREKIEDSIRANTVMLYSESITNPLLRVEDIEGIIKIAAVYHLKVMIDNTFATPYHIRPIELGADLVAHSATKYIGGHSDVSAGVIVGSKEMIEKVKAKVVNLGCNLSPFEAWLGSRGLKTLALRMEKQSANAQILADRLADHPAMEQVYYPIAAANNGNGAIVTIELKKEVDIHEFSKNLEWIKIVPTLAGVETTVSYPFGTSHRPLPEALRIKLGVTSQMLRISVGIEDPEDIVETFLEALAATDTKENSNEPAYESPYLEENVDEK